MHKRINMKNNNSEYITCFKYYSLPEFPQNCVFSFNSDLHLRDVFGCTSVDRHYEYPKFQDFSYDIGCNEKGVIKAVEHFQSKNDIFVLFRTGYTKLDLTPKKQYFIGYYKIARAYEVRTSILGKNKKFLGFEADDVVLLSKKDSIEAPEDFPKRGPIDIFSTKGKYQELLNNTLYCLQEKKNSILNVKEKYKSYIKKLVYNLIQPDYRNALFKYCNDECSNSECYLKASLMRNYQRNNENYLNYLYSPHVFYSHYIKKLKSRKRMVLL